MAPGRRGRDAPEARDAGIAPYHDRLAQGFAAQGFAAQGFAAQGFAAQPQPPPPRPARTSPRRRGQPKQSPAKNLLDARLPYSDRVLAFVDDLTMPFTTTQAERARRLAQGHQKIAGTVRGDGGATA